MHSLRYTLIARTVILVILVVVAQLVAEDEDPGTFDGIAKLSVGASVGKSSGGSSLWDDPSNSGAVSQSVNLYTGQHAESFPLMGLRGRDGFGASLSIDYSGNVFRQARLENYRAQASPFGLGFTLGQQSIVTDHQGTADIADDRYSLVVDDAVIALKPKPGTVDSFVTETGEPWIIIRTTGAVTGATCVLKWIIKKEDGTIYQFGDGSPTPANWNATRNILRYGTFVGNGITDNDSVYAFQWDLKVIRDIDSLHWVELSYQRDQKYLHVGHSEGTIVSSHNSYTAASYLSTVRTDDNRSLVLYYSSRQDADTIFGYNNYEFSYSKKCDSIDERSGTGQLVARLKLRYSYLNADLYTSIGNPLKKLLLDRIERWSADGTSDQLPPLSFQYVTDTSSASFGALQTIHYPSGAEKEVVYGTIAGEANFARLDYSAVAPTELQPMTWASDNIYIVHLAGSSNWIVAVWDGYWHIDTVSASNSYSDRPGILANQCVVIPKNGNDLLVRRWKGGHWQDETLTGTFTRYNSVFIYPSDECFLLVTGTYSTETGTMHRRSTYYSCDENEWNYQSVVALGGSDTQYKVGGVRLHNDMVVLSLWCENNCIPGGLFGLDGSKVFWGRWQAQNDTLMMDSVLQVEEDGRFIKGSILIGHDYVGWQTKHYLQMRQWNGTGWTAREWGESSSPAWYQNGLSETGNGVVWSYSNSTGSYSHIDMLVPDDTGFAHHAQYASSYWIDNRQVSGIWSSRGGTAEYFGSFTPDMPLYMTKWDGNSFQQIHTISADETDMSLDKLELSDYSYVYGPIRGKATGDVIARRWLGGSAGWDSYTTALTSNNDYGARDGIEVTGDLFTCHRGDSMYIYRYDLFGHGRNYYPIPLYGKGSWDQMGSWVKPGRDFFAIDAKWHAGDYHNPPWDSTKYSSTLYRSFGEAVLGKAPFLVVDSIVTRQYAEDPNPIITQYDYYGGLLDRSGNTPRFCKTKVSMPYFAGESPDGFVVHCFYNDVDNSGFADGSIYDSLDAPDLDASAEFGIDSGGYRLDGMEYLTYSYDGTAEDTSGLFDMTRSHYTLYHPTGFPSDIYRTRLSSVTSRKDSLVSVVSYIYEDATNQVRETRTRYVNDSSYISDSLIYAWEGSDSIRTDNALTLVRQQRRILQLDGTHSLLSKSGSTFVRKGTWLPSKNFVWRTFESVSDSIEYTDSLFTGLQSFDSRGNIVGSCSSNGRITSTKFDATGNMPISVSVGCKSDAFVVQDFEQTSGWDGWVLPSNSYKGLSILKSHTGSHSYRVLDSTDTGDNVGPSRIMDGSVLSDSIYWCTFWVRSSKPVKASLVLSPSGTTLSSTFTAGGTIWRKYDCYFNVASIWGQSGKSMKLVLSMQNGTTSDTAFFDDIRLYPINASISTVVYDTVTLRTIAAAGSDNLHIIKTYDEFGRPDTTKNTFAEVLSTREYHVPLLESTINADISSPSEYQVDSSTVVLSRPQSVSYTLEVSNNAMANIQARVYKNSTQMAFVACGGTPCGESATGTFAASTLDTIKVKVVSVAGGDIEAHASATFADYAYGPDNLPWVKTTNYHSSGSIGVSVAFSDSYGRTVQSRKRDTLNGAERALVGGVATYDARGRIVRSYKPFYDVLGSSGVSDLSSAVQAAAEADSFYNGNSNRGPDCQHMPYSESDYASSVDSRIDSSGAPGAELGFGSTRTSKSFSASVISGVESPYAISVRVDPDQLVDTSLADQWGRWSKQITPFRVDDDSSSHIVVKTSSDLASRYQVTELDTAGDSLIMLRRSWSNVLGQVDSTWKVDYGKVRMLYDRAGRLRFAQDQSMRDSGLVVYYKYDLAGRKVEEGTASSIYFTQAFANTLNEPTSPYKVGYHWYYDYYKSGSVELVAPGRLVRVRNADSSYYRNYYHYPTADSDKVVVKLPQGASAKRKMIKHFYNRDGSLQKLVVYPDSATTNGVRVYAYVYDGAGRIKAIRQGALGQTLDTLDYVSYDYNPDGSYRVARYGKYDFELEEPVVIKHDTLQVVNYWYSPEGRLVQMNQAGAVVQSSTGSGTHVGTSFEYHPDNDPIGYYNGRVRMASTANSSPSGVVRHDWQYTYDDRGWLTQANDTLNPANYRQEFFYNALGQRKKQVVGGADTISYTYDTQTPGSSKLLSITGSAYPMEYDAVGNLVKDTSRGVYKLLYDYRNLMVNSYSAPNLAGGANTNVVCVYNESGQRIKKGYSYSYWADCPPPEELLMGGSGLESDDSLQMSDSIPVIYPESQDGLGGEETMGSSGGGGQCLYTAAAATYYLYDGGVLLATFDHNDKVIDMFVNGPTGRIASYYQDSTSQLYYFLTDQVGSTRLVMKGVPSQTYEVAEYYNYYPFGEAFQSWGNYPTSFKFSSKEHDLHGGFNYHYFGARYYDPRLGQFASIDAAGQYASGYVYGNNNPIMGIDPDGNLFFLAGIGVAAFWGAVYSVGPAIATATVSGDWRGFGKSILSGAMTGGLGGALSAGGKALGTFGKSSVFKLFSNAGASAATSSAMGNKWSYQSMIASTLGGLAASEVMGDFNATEGGWLKNASREVLHSAASGAVSGFVGGVSYNAMMKQSLTTGLGRHTGLGVLGGASQAAWKSAVFGAPRLAPENQRAYLETLRKLRGAPNLPVFRRGGLWGAIAPTRIRGGFAGMGRDVIVNQEDVRIGVTHPDIVDYQEGLWTHEAMHYFQDYESGYATAAGHGLWEHTLFNGDPYTTIGTYEWDAEFTSRVVRGLKY